MQGSSVCDRSRHLFLPLPKRAAVLRLQPLQSSGGGEANYGVGWKRDWPPLPAARPVNPTRGGNRPMCGAVEISLRLPDCVL